MSVHCQDLIYTRIIHMILKISCTLYIYKYGDFQGPRVSIYHIDMYIYMILKISYTLYIYKYTGFQDFSYTLYI